MAYSFQLKIFRLFNVFVSSFFFFCVQNDPASAMHFRKCGVLGESNHLGLGMCTSAQKNFTQGQEASIKAPLVSKASKGLLQKHV
jgi:hypothetical protein